jgi:acylphosphatase
MKANQQDPSARLHALVSGMVQGVGYRYFALNAANQLGLLGWVRNLPDGSVEVVAEGARDVLDAYLGILERGLRSARVEAVRPIWYLARGEFDRFEVRF